MALLAYGLGILVVLLLLGYGFVNAKPAALARFALWFGILLAVAVAALLIESGRFIPVVFALGALAPFFVRAKRAWNRWRGAAGGGGSQSQVSEVETDYLRMSLDHGSGTMTGTVRKGFYRGHRLDELDRAALLSLWRECRADDPPSVALLETYLDRFMPDWRGGEGDEASSHSQGAGARSTSAMSREEAYEILGLKPGATSAEIKEAHRRLMMKLHPDQGGSNTLAAQVNRAKDVLLRG